MANFKLDDDTVEVEVTFLVKKTGTMRDTLAKVQEMMNDTECEVFLVNKVEGTEQCLWAHEGSYGLHKPGENPGVWIEIDE